jgi:hypothetical protein
MMPAMARLYRPVVRSLLVVVAACNASTPVPPDAPHWSTYTIPAGDHDATLDGADYLDPLDGIVTATSRDYDLIFDPSAIYILVEPTQPDDQLDWNKLPGLSDCNTLDLSQAGAMFGWRWRIDLQQLEVTAYANNLAVHETPDAPLFTLTAADLAARIPIHYRLSIDGDVYRFEARDHAVTLARGCPDVAADAGKWAAGFYFGGTSTAPSQITASISEPFSLEP